MKRTVILGFHMVVLAGLNSLAVAQTAVVAAKPLTESDIALLRQDVQAHKMEIIARTMQFTDAEATGFWPVYREYANEQQKIGDRKYQLIKDYAQSYGQMTDAKAAELTDRMFDLDKSILENRMKYWPEFQKVLRPKRAAKFYQVDRRLSLMIDLELASEIPVLE